MNYRLLYETERGYVDLDLGDEKPAMTYQINNLNELKDRQAAFSQAIKLPKTSSNLRTLGFIDDFNVVADAAYAPKRCQLFCQGALLTPFGSMLYVREVDQNRGGSIECQIVSATADLFSLMAGVDNENMGDEIWKSTWITSKVVSENADPSGVRRWPMVFTEQGQMPPTTQIRQIQVYHLVPCYHYNTLVKELFAKYGYDLESNLTADPDANQMYVSASKIKNASSMMVSFYAQSVRVPGLLGNIGVPNASIEPPNEDISQSDVLGGNVPVYNPDAPQSPLSEMRYYATQPGEYTAVVNLMNGGLYNIDSTRRLRMIVTTSTNGSVATIFTDDQLSIPGSGGGYGKEFTVKLNTGDYIAVRVDIYTRSLSTSSTFVNFVMDVYPSTEDPKPGVGASFDYVQSTGFKSHKEIIQSYMQLFGAMVDVQQTKESGEGVQAHLGKVRLYTFEELYRRRDAGQFVDWSDKLVLDRERVVGFSISNYAQKNTISLKDNSDDGTSDSGSFTVNNKTLEGDKTLFTVAVEAGRDVKALIDGSERTIAVVPTLEREVDTDDSGKEEVMLTYKGCDVHLIRMTDQKVTVVNNTGYRSSGYYYEIKNISLPLAVTVPMQDLVDRYYKRVSEMLHNAKTTSEYFNLNTLDIDQLDLFTPVWVKYYGAYFYISKINNFVAEQLTKVDLIKM